MSNHSYFHIFNVKQLCKLAQSYKLARAKMLTVHPNASKKIYDKEMPLTPEDIEQARQALNDYLTNQVEDEAKDMALQRYQFILTKVSNGWYGDLDFEYNIVPKAAATGTNEDNKTTYKSPQEALEAIPQRSEYAYRGMSFDEFQEAMRRGYIKSRGGYNLGQIQEGLTFFSPEAESAQYYASGFAPWKYKPTHNKPGVVIAIDKDWMLTPEQHSGVPEGELALEGEIPTYTIDYIYYIIPTEIKWGKLRLTEERNGKFSVNFALQPTIYNYSIVKIK